MSVVNCKVDKEQITVGDHLLLTCAGSEASGSSVKKLEFKLNETNKYTLKLFKKAPVGENSFNLDFTIYAPGDYKISDLILTDGVNDIVLSGATVKVGSVLQPSKDGKPQEAFGFILPIGMSIPIYYYLILTVFLLVAGLYAGYRIKRHHYYKKLKAKLKQYASPIDPDTQFYKAIRMAEKAEYPLDQIEKAFSLYNLRAYRLPMFDLTNDRIIKYFKRNYPQYKKTRIQLHRLLGEFEELSKNNNLSIEEKNEFVKKLYRYVDANNGLNL